MYRFLITALLLLAGCSKPTPPPFVGEPAKELVYFDLVGTWDIMRYQTVEQADDPNYQDEGRFDAKWVLERLENTLIWRDVHGQGEFELLHYADGEYLYWKSPKDHRWFSINRVSFGHLDLSDNKGQHYIMVRTDGGQDLPYLDRPGVTRVEKGKQQK
jgi:hypothetical protein